MHSSHTFDQMRFSSVEEEREPLPPVVSNDIQQQISRCSNVGIFIDHSLRWIKPSRYDILPYIHVIIVMIAHVLLYGGVNYWIENAPAYLHDTMLDAVLSSNETLRSIKVASVSIGVILLLDLLVDVIQSLISYYRSEETTAQMTFRAKEWTVRALFILSLVEPACVMLIVPPVPTTPVVIFAYCSAFAKNITFVCMGVFCLSNTFDKTPKEFLRSLLISLSFASGQIFMHYSAMTDQTAGMVLLSQFGLILSIFPLIFYMYNCLYYLRQIWLKIRREGGFSNVSLREYTFLAYAVSTCLGIIITLIVVLGFNGLYYYNSSLTDLELYDMSIMCYALLATIVPARIARIEAKQATTRVIVTKKNVTEKLSNPLMEVYLGLDKLLHTDNVVEHLQPADMLQLSQLTLTCNEALHCLEGIVSMNVDERQTMESESSGNEKDVGIGKVWRSIGTAGHKPFTTRVMSSIVASTSATPLPPTDRFLVNPRNHVTFSDEKRDDHHAISSYMSNPRRADSIFSRHNKMPGQQDEQEVISILSNSKLSDSLVANKQRNSNEGWGIRTRASSDKGSSDLTISLMLKKQNRPHVNIFQNDVGTQEIIVATGEQHKQQQQHHHRSKDLSTTCDGKEAEAMDEPPLRPTAHTFGGAYIKSSNSMLQMALGRNMSSTVHKQQQQHRSMFALPSIPEAVQTTIKALVPNEETGGGGSAHCSQKSTDWLLADDAEKNDNDSSEKRVTSVVLPQNEWISSEVEPTMTRILPTIQSQVERVPLPLPIFIAEHFNRGRRYTLSEVTSDMDKTSADYSALSMEDAPSYTFTYDYSFNAGSHVEDDKPLYNDYNHPPRIPLSAKLTPLQLYSKLPSSNIVRTRYSHMDGTNPQLLELVATEGVRHTPRMILPTLDVQASVIPISQRRAYIRSVSSSVALGFVPIGSAAGVDRDGQPLGCSSGGDVKNTDIIRETNGDAIALFTWRLLAVVRADLRAASDLFDLQLSSLLTEPTPEEAAKAAAAAATPSSSSGGVTFSEDRLREAFLLKCAQWKAMEEDGMVELRAHLNVVQTMVLKAAVSLSVTLDCVLLSDAADREGKLDSGERDRRPVSFSPPVSLYTNNEY